MGEQREAVERDVRSELDIKMPARIKEIKEWLSDNRGQWEGELIRSFEKLFSIKKEKEVSYLQICFLRTSLLMDRYHYRAYLYDRLYHLDQEPVWVDVDTMFVYQFFQEDIQELRQKLLGTYKHLYPNDIMVIKELCAFYPIGLMKMCIESILPEILKTGAYTRSKRTENFRILFGEYLGRAEVIHGSVDTGTGKTHACEDK